jgi:hypothetical protein
MDDIIALKKYAAENAELHSVPRVDLSKARVGDLVVRAFAGLPMILTVGKIENGIIYTIPESNDKNPFSGGITVDEGWQFDIATQMEVDDYLGWGPKHGVTGSYITHLIEK